MNEQFLPEDFWRAVTLYGLNSATYKIAVAKCLIQYGRGDQSDIPGATRLRLFCLYKI